MLLNDDPPTLLRGRRLHSHQPHPLENWDALEMGGHTVILLLGDGAMPSPTPYAASGAVPQVRSGPAPQPAPPPRPSPVPAPTPAPVNGGAIPPIPGEAAYAAGFAQPPGMAAPPPPVTPPRQLPALTVSSPGQGAGAPPRPGGMNGGRIVPHSLGAPVQDHIDEMILLTLPTREVSAHVDETVAFQVEIVNAGDLVSSFDVQVEGVDPEWVVILPAQINLNEGESGIVSITVTAPRHYSSVAGRYHLAVTVTTPEYPDRYSQVGATLALEPFYDVQVGDLSRKRQVSSWGNPVTESQFLLANGGNSVTQVQVEAMDEERALHFEFQMLNDPMLYARQTEVRLEPGMQTEVTLLAEPNHRSMISLRNRTYQFDVRATPLGGQQFPRVIGGQVKVVPLIGKAIITLTLFLLTALLVVFFSPRVRTFEVSPAVVDAGTPVVLSWEASRFSAVNISGMNLGNVPPVPVGTVVLEPTGSDAYTIQANNFISRLGIRLFETERRAEVAVTPVAPGIALNVSRGSIITGEQVTLSWSVERADRVTLLINGNPEPLPTDQFVWSRTLQPDVDTSIRIEASNPSVAGSGSVFFASDTIRVVTPTPTPLPNPSVLVFDVGPPIITAGEVVNLQWRVANSPSVSIEGVGVELPPEGSRQLYPLQTTTYVLRAITLGGETFSDEITVVVNPPPTSTPMPLAPQIEFFRANPVEYILGQDDPVQLSWSVRGNVTGVQIFSPDLQISANFSRTGSLPVSPARTTFFILTATNQDQSSTAQVDITVLEPTPTPTPLPTETPTPTPVPTGTPIPAPLIIFFGIESAESPPRPDEVRQTGTNQYEIVAGALIRLRWSVGTATRVGLRGIGVSTIDYGSRPFDGDLTLQYTGDINQFELTGVNDPAGVGAQDPSTRQVLNIDVRQIIPRSPTNLVGSVVDGQNRLSWSYDAASQQRITGFRIYRADVPTMNFVTVAQVGSTETNWLDTFTPNCDKAYFVVAIYDNFQGQTLETAPSPTSWFSPSCSG